MKTPGEWAIRVVSQFVVKAQNNLDHVQRDILHTVAADAIRAAVEAEREACAKVAEDAKIVEGGRGWSHYEDAGATRNNIADAIRARGKEGA